MLFRRISFFIKPTQTDTSILHCLFSYFVIYEYHKKSVGNLGRHLSWAALRYPINRIFSCKLCQKPFQKWSGFSFGAPNFFRIVNVFLLCYLFLFSSYLKYRLQVSVPVLHIFECHAKRKPPPRFPRAALNLRHLLTSLEVTNLYKTNAYSAPDVN